MNGYLSPCAGEPCPPVFRSPVDSMEDIMDNQVICAIYRLPDVHKHITRPPPGVIFPKKIVSSGDLKPAPTLWHEDSGRKPWHENSGNGNSGRNPWQNNSGNNPHDSARPAHPGSISGRQLGDAARRLVVNSLHVKANSNGYGSQIPAHQLPYRDPPYHPSHSSYASNGRYDQGHPSLAPPPRALQHTQVQHQNSYYPPNRPQSHQHFDRYHPYQSGHQNDGHAYPRRPIITPGLIPGAYQAAGYIDLRNYQLAGPPGYQGHDAYVPPPPNMGRGYNRPQQSGNQYSGLDRRGNRRAPPPSHHGRR